MSDIVDLDSDYSYSEDEAVQVPKELQSKVKDYVQLDNDIRAKSKELAELKKKRKPLEEYVLKYLDIVGEKVIEINDGKLIRNKAETKVPLTKDHIKDSIKKRVQNPDDVEYIMGLLDTERPTKTRINLKRTGTSSKK